MATLSQRPSPGALPATFVQFASLARCATTPLRIVPAGSTDHHFMMLCS
jgi:hypothetical protein